MENFSQTAAFLWSVADLLRGDLKQSQYGRIILPFTLLRRLECVLEEDKKTVLAAHKTIDKFKLPEAVFEKKIRHLVRKETGKDSLHFFNTSALTLNTLGQSSIKDDLHNYIQGFSKDAREIFEHFKFDEFISLLNDANLLYKVVKIFAQTDLSPQAINNHEMGLIFEELIRRFAESSNETAGEHFTPRDIVKLTTSLVFINEDLTQKGAIHSIYDPTAGTGGFLSTGMDYVTDMNPSATLALFGQELNPESYAICKADMLIKGQDVTRIKLGNTLSNDQLFADKFDYMLSNPPFGVDWKKIEREIKDEHSIKGAEGRFAAGLPRVSDGSLLFLMHLISKLRDTSSNAAGELSGGGRIGIILNGSPLFTGGAGSGESEIRRHILESDLLEAIIALPNDMFYNTGIATYIWILSNKKQPERQGKVQLINGVSLCGKMRKSLGSKRNEMSDEDMRTITQCFGGFTVIDNQLLDKPAEQKSNRGRQSATPKTDSPKTFASKIFASTDFGYRRITIERPLRLSVQMDEERINSLRFAPNPLKAPMQWIWEQYGPSWNKGAGQDQQLNTAEIEQTIKAELKASYPTLKDKQIKELLSPKLWLFQRDLLDKAQQLQKELAKQMGEEAIINAPCHDFNQFDAYLKKALKTADIKLDTKEKKQLLDAISWKNPDAEPVIKKVLEKVTSSHSKATKYGAAFTTVNGQKALVEYQADGELRDNENVPLDPAQTTKSLIESYFDREVSPHVPDAWIDANKRDAKDEEIGIVGYEIPFNRHFYQYQPPRSLEEIDADLDRVSAEIMDLLREVHS